jgi:hypothetical protein
LLLQGWREHGDRLLLQVGADVAALASGVQELQLQVGPRGGAPMNVRMSPLRWLLGSQADKG